VDEAYQPKTKFYWKRSESVAHRLKRIVTAALAAAVNHLNHAQASLAEAIHEARKSIKKVRSVLHLLRPVLGADFAAENDRQRAIRRKLSTLRDAHALIETVDHLNAEYRDELEDESLTTLRQALVDQTQAREEQFDSDHRNKLSCLLA
jgi:CHAD domain-containing protein